MDDKFNAKKYWKSFEILAVKVVKIQIKGFLNYDDLQFYEDHVPLTRDHGIDGSLHIVLNGKDISITIEAKLRSKGPLGLKEFASSIVNYFVNLSDIHFIVTNVEYSDDAKNILMSIRKKKEKNCLNYIDGFYLQNNVEKISYDDCELEEQKLLKELISYIREQKYSYTLQVEDEVSREITKQTVVESTYILPEHKNAIKDIHDFLQGKNCFLIVEGDKGIGKSYVINKVFDYYKEVYSIVPIDLSSDWSKQTLLVEIAKEILQFDCWKILALLSESDKQELRQNITEYTSTENDYLIALKQILFFDPKENKYYNYLIRTFLTNIIEKTKIQIILYLYDCVNISYETSKFFLNIFPSVSHKIKIIVEIDNPPIFEESKAAKDFINSIHQFSQGEVFAKIYPLNECKKDDAKEFVEKCLNVPCTGDIADYICSRYGYNLMILTDVVDFINRNGIKTKWEISRMPLVQFGTFSGQLLNQYCQRLTQEDKKAFLWSVCAMELMEGGLNYDLLEDLQDELKNDQIGELLVKIPFFMEISDAIIVKNITYRHILKEYTPSFYKFQVIKFLLTKEEHWSLSDIQSMYKKCCFHLIIKQNVDLVQINQLISCLSTQNLETQKNNLIFLCYQYYSHKEGESLNALCFLVQYLESLSDKLIFCNKENKKLLEEADFLCQKQIKIQNNNTSINLYEVQVKILFLFYNQQKTMFRFDLAEQYIDKGLLLEKYCQDIELIGKLYWCKGLCLKERGIKPGFLEFMLKGIHKYPNAMYLKICYLSNFASSNFKNDLGKSYKALSVGITLAQKAKLIDLEIWLSNNKIICDLIRKDFSAKCLKQIIDIREKADKYELLSDISRAYNNEGIWHFQKENIQESLCCLQHSLNIFDETVTDQQKFLFRTNKIVCLLKKGMSIYEDLCILYTWLRNNYQIILNKLKNTTNIEKENNYAAILSLYKSALISNESWFSEKLAEWFQYTAFNTIKKNIADAFDNNDIIDRAFIVNNEIFILF